MPRVAKIAFVVGGIVAVVLLSWPRSPKPPVSDAGYDGKQFEQVVEELGPPEHSDSFRMGQPLDEMRVPLLNHFPLTDARNRDVVIRESTWREGDYFITVWFVKEGEVWRAVDGIRWHKSIRF